MPPTRHALPPELPAGTNGRCAREHRCVDAIRIHPDTPDTDPYLLGAPAVTVGDAASGLCPRCTRYLTYAIAGLPRDLLELGQLLTPSMAVRYRDPGMPTQPKVKLHSPMPLQADPLALQQLIDHETTVIAAAVAHHTRIPWDVAAEQHLPMQTRVHRACQLLAYRHEWLIGLGPVPLPVRSTGHTPHDGWPDALVERMWLDHDGETWLDRDGAELALALLDLHAQCLDYLGHTPHDRLRVPCPDCNTVALTREHRHHRVVCRRCWTTLTDDAYEQMVAVRAITLTGATR